MKNLDLANLEVGDGFLDDQIRRKINGNFRRLASVIQQEQPAASSEALTQYVNQYVSSYVDQALEQTLPQIVQDAFSNAYPVGSVILCTSSSDPRLSTGTWERIAQGRYLLGADADHPVNDQGGSGASELPGTLGTIYGQDPGTAESEAEYLSWPAGSEQPEVAVEPPYHALLVYRRTA